MATSAGSGTASSSSSESRSAQSPPPARAAAVSASAAAEGGWRGEVRQRAGEKRVREAWERLQKPPPGQAKRAAVVPGPGPGAEGVPWAREALARAKAAGKGLGVGQVLIRERRNFAGEEVEVEREVAGGSREAAAAAAKEASRQRTRGIDVVLEILEKRRRVNIVDKSRIDWKGAKRADEHLAKELDAHRMGADKHTDKQAFLARTDLRRFEQEKEDRLRQMARRGKG